MTNRNQQKYYQSPADVQKQIEAERRQANELAADTEALRRAITGETGGEPTRYAEELTGGRWITIGSKSGKEITKGPRKGQKKRVGGSPVYVKGSEIVAGADGLEGKSLDKDSPNYVGKEGGGETKPKTSGKKEKKPSAEEIAEQHQQWLEENEPGQTPVNYRETKEKRKKERNSPEALKKRLAAGKKALGKVDAKKRQSLINAAYDAFSGEDGERELDSFAKSIGFNITEDGSAGLNQVQQYIENKYKEHQKKQETAEREEKYWDKVKEDTRQAIKDKDKPYMSSEELENWRETRDEAKKLLEEAKANEAEGRRLIESGKQYDGKQLINQAANQRMEGNQLARRAEAGRRAERKKSQEERRPELEKQWEKRKRTPSEQSLHEQALDAIGEQEQPPQEQPAETSEEKEPSGADENFNRVEAMREEENRAREVSRLRAESGRLLQEAENVYRQSGNLEGEELENVRALSEELKNQGNQIAREAAQKEQELRDFRSMNFHRRTPAERAREQALSQQIAEEEAAKKERGRSIELKVEKDDRKGKPPKTLLQGPPSPKPPKTKGKPEAIERDEERYNWENQNYHSRLAEAGGYDYLYDPAQRKNAAMKPKNFKAKLEEAEERYVRALQDGYYTDGVHAYKPTKQTLAAAQKAAPKVEDGEAVNVAGHLSDMDKNTAENAARPVGFRPPIKAGGKRADEGSLAYSDGEGRHALFDSQFIDTVLNDYPEATIHLNKDDPTGAPAVIKSGNEVIGAMQPRTLPKDQQVWLPKEYYLKGSRLMKYARQLSGGQWITIGGKSSKDNPGKDKGGARVYVKGSEIVAGPDSLKGGSLDKQSENYIGKEENQNLTPAERKKKRRAEIKQWIGEDRDEEREVKARDRERKRAEKEEDKYFKEYKKERVNEAIHEARLRKDAVDELLGNFGYTGHKAGGFKKAVVEANERGDYDSIPGFDLLTEYSRQHPELGLPQTDDGLFEFLLSGSLKINPKTIRLKVEEELDAQRQRQKEEEEISFDFGANDPDYDTTPFSRLAGSNEPMRYAQMFREADAAHDAKMQYADELPEGGRWITIGSKAGKEITKGPRKGQRKKTGGARVYIGKGGDILAGPDKLEGASVDKKAPNYIDKVEGKTKEEKQQAGKQEPEKLPVETSGKDEPYKRHKNPLGNVKNTPGRYLFMPGGPMGLYKGTAPVDDPEAHHDPANPMHTGFYYDTETGEFMKMAITGKLRKDDSIRNPADVLQDVQNGLIRRGAYQDEETARQFAEQAGREFNKEEWERAKAAAESIKGINEDSREEWEKENRRRRSVGEPQITYGEHRRQAGEEEKPEPGSQEEADFNQTNEFRKSIGYPEQTYKSWKKQREEKRGEKQPEPEQPAETSKQEPVFDEQGKLQPIEFDAGKHATVNITGERGNFQVNYTNPFGVQHKKKYKTLKGATRQAEKWAESRTVGETDETKRQADQQQTEQNRQDMNFGGGKNASQELTERAEKLYNEDKYMLNVRQRGILKSLVDDLKRGTSTERLTTENVAEKLERFEAEAKRAREAEKLSSMGAEKLGAYLRKGSGNFKRTLEAMQKTGDREQDKLSRKLQGAANTGPEAYFRTPSNVSRRAENAFRQVINEGGSIWDALTELDRNAQGSNQAQRYAKAKRAKIEQLMRPDAPDPPKRTGPTQGEHGKKLMNDINNRESAQKAREFLQFHHNLLTKPQFQKLAGEMGITVNGPKSKQLEQAIIAVNQKLKQAENFGESFER